MLSFLKDSNSEELPAENQGKNPQKNEQEYLTVATRAKELRKSNTILCVLFIIGLGIMIKKSAPQQVSAEVVDTERLEIEQAIMKLIDVKSEMFNRMDEIVDKFYEFSNVMQIDVSELVKNPFQLETFLQNFKAENENSDISEIDSEAIWREQIQSKSKGMKLTSIMRSDKGYCCMIDNKILYEGDLIKDFTVKTISSDAVTLELQGVEINLQMPK